MKTRQVMEYIRAYKRKYEEGFTEEEVFDILWHFGLAPDVFYDKLGCCTMMVKDGNTLLYQYDMEVGVRACLENRKLYGYEFD